MKKLDQTDLAELTRRFLLLNWGQLPASTTSGVNMYDRI